MLNNFERETHDLTDYELTLVQPMVNGLRTKVGKINAITNKQMVVAMRYVGYNINEVRVRKIINHIRRNGLVTNLIASSNGYWVERDPKRIEEYIESLEQRRREIGRIIASFRNN